MQKNVLKFAIFLFSLFTFACSYSQQTKRIPQFSNEEVNVWQTIIYPNNNQILKMHRHEYNRVLIAFDAGTLKVTNDKGKSHYLSLKKDHAYYLKKDIPNENHMDENISHHPIKVIVIELKK